MGSISHTIKAHIMAGPRRNYFKYYLIAAPLQRDKMILGLFLA
jgi:hypothetical protein